MLHRGLEELVYRIGSDMRRHAECRFSDLGTIVGSYDGRSHRWFFRADLDGMRCIQTTMCASEMEYMNVKLPSEVTRIYIHPGRHGHKNHVELFTSDNRRWNIPRRDDLLWKQEYMCDIKGVSGISGSGGSGSYAMGVDLAAEPKKSRKEQLKESRPERLARLWKWKYEMAGVKPKTLTV